MTSVHRGGSNEGRSTSCSASGLGTAEKVAALVQDRAAPLPLEATSRQVGLPGTLWWAAQDSGVFDLLPALWPAPQSGPSTAHYLLLAALQRIC